MFDLCVVILRPSAMKYAVFGNSYVSRLGRSDLSLCLPGEVRFFARGGMRVVHVPNDEWLQMMVFSPDHVILHFGGNNLTKESVPRTVGDKLLSLVEELKSSGVQSVLVCEVVPRACVSRSPGLTLDCYEGQRKSLNQMLHRATPMCVYSNSRNDVPRVAQRYGTIAAHTRRRASVLVVFVVFCVHMYSFAGLIRRTPPPTFSDTAITDRHSDTTIFQLRAHWLRISWSIGSEKSFGHVPPVGVEPSTSCLQGGHPIH